MPAPHEHSTLVLVGGHESDNGADLAFLASHFPGVLISPAGRPLHRVVTAELESRDRPVVVVPLTFGRNPTVVADAAKTLKWLATGPNDGRIALSQPFGTQDHLIAWLRTAATTIASGQPNAAMVIAARASNPFDDAELYRVAHLVRTHGSVADVDVACVDSDDSVLDRLQRLRLLGFDESVIVPAGFSRSSTAPFGSGEFVGARFYGPLMSEQAIVQVIRDRVAQAEHDLGHGQDGIADGLQADHGHGYAHSHAFEESQGGHGHTHPHNQHAHNQELNTTVIEVEGIHHAWKPQVPARN